MYVHVHVNAYVHVACACAQPWLVDQRVCLCLAYYYTALPLTTGAVMARPSPWRAKVAMAGQPAEEV